MAEVMSDTAVAAVDMIISEAEGNGEEIMTSSSVQQPPATGTKAAHAPTAEIDLFSNLNVVNTPPLVASEEVKVGGVAKEASIQDEPTPAAGATGDESPGEKKMEDDPITISTPADPQPNNNGHDDILLNFGVSNSGETETACDNINQETAAPSNDLDLLGFGVGQPTATATETPVASTNTPNNDDAFGHGPQLIDQPMDIVVETTSSTMDSGFDFLGMSSPPPPVENSDNDVYVPEQETNETSFEPRATETETIGGDCTPNENDNEGKPADVNNNEEGTAQPESEIPNPGQANLVDEESVVPSSDTNPQINENDDGIVEDLQETNETKIDAEGGNNKSDKNEVDRQAKNETLGEPNSIADTMPIGNEDQPAEDIKINQEEPADVAVKNNANGEVDVPSENETTVEATPHQNAEEGEERELIQSQSNEAENNSDSIAQKEEDAQEESEPIDNTETTDQNGGEKEEGSEELIQPEHAEDVANNANVDAVGELIQSQSNEAENNSDSIAQKEEDAQEVGAPIDNTETTDQNGGEKEEGSEELIQPEHAEDVANNANVDAVGELIQSQSNEAENNSDSIAQKEDDAQEVGALIDNTETTDQNGGEKEEESEELIQPEHAEDVAINANVDAVGELIQSQSNEAENNSDSIAQKEGDAREVGALIDNTETTDQNGGGKGEETEELIQPEKPTVNAVNPSQHVEDVANDANIDVVSEAAIESLPQTNTSLTAEEPINYVNVSHSGNGDVVDCEQEEDEWRSMHSASDSDCPDATANAISEPTIVSLPNQATSNPNVEEISTDVGGNGGSESDIGVSVERTQEEEEWLSMGLGLGDALRQIVALTEERESALVMCQEKDAGKTQVESVLVEVQSRLGAEMNQRAEYESQVRKMRETLQAYEAQLTTYQTMEDDLEKAQASLVTAVSEKSKIEMEVQKLREIRDESQQKEVVLSNRLNDAKKKEANKSTAAGRLEVNNEQLREDLQKVTEELDTTSKAKAKLESNMEKLKAKAVERVKQAETALAEERELNEERKKKMKFFVETKSDELREAKDSSNDMQKELEETRASLRSSRDREEAYHKELDAAKLKHRELQRDMERMKRSSEQLHKIGKTYKDDLEQSASETEEHKKKRAAAKHEIMQMVRTLEVEQAVSSKLKEGIKFTFTPKALSQQELLNECLREFEIELERLAAKMGKTLVPTPESTQHSSGVPADSTDAPMNGAARKSKKSRAAKADMDTERLITNLEQETQQVSKGIMALAGSVERMRSLLGDENMFGCMTYLSNILAGPGEAKHHQLGDADAQEEHATSAQFV